MHSCDIVGFIHCEGFVLCDSCGDENSDDESPIFGENSYELHGSTCDQCQSYYEPLDENWISKDYAISENLRWAKCKRCNHQMGFDKNARGYSRKRLEALRNNYKCNCCHNLMHF